MRYGELEALHTHMTQKAHRRLDDHDIQLLRIDSTISKYEAQLYSVQYQLQQAFMLIAQQEKMLKQLIKEESSC
jgi:transposase-like protein